MILRAAATVLAIGLTAGLCGAGPALADITLDGTADLTAEAAGAALADAVTAAATSAPGTAAICQRNARVDTLSASILFDFYARQIAVRTYVLQTEDAFAPADDTMNDAAKDGWDLTSKMDMVIAEQRASLPDSAHDLPLLMLLAKYEDTGNPIMALVLSPDIALLPEIYETLERQGLTDTVRALRLVQASMPDWIEDQGSWVGIYGAAPSPRQEADLATAKAGVDAAERLYPDRSARTAAIAMIEGDRALMAAITANLATGDDDAAMYWLMDQLWTSCYQETYSADQGEQAFAALGTPQAAILLLDAIVLEAAEGTLEYYFIGSSGTMAPTTARVLDIRGLTAEADALRTGMALFGTPYPRDDWAREDALNGFTDDQRAQLAALAAVFDEDMLWAEMTLIARDAGLLPGKAPTP